MRFYIIIPAHNEESTIDKTLESLSKQTYLPTRVIVVNDNSTDNTEHIVSEYSSKFEWITYRNIKSLNQHTPGAKVVRAFYKGLETLDDDYDVICKYDADIILPANYLERLKDIFTKNKSVGIAGGLAYTKKNGHWTYENISSKNHVRGPFKSYRKACFEAIGGLKKSIGWDTVDVLLARYHDWDTVTDKNLVVKHLKPTGSSYNKSSRYLQGEALYKMRYGFLLATITALKIAHKRKSLISFTNYVIGYFKAKDRIVTKNEGKFIRKLRWKDMLKKWGVIPK